MPKICHQNTEIRASAGNKCSTLEGTVRTTSFVRLQELGLAVVRLTDKDPVITCALVAPATHGCYSAARYHSHSCSTHWIGNCRSGGNFKFAVHDYVHSGS